VNGDCAIEGTGWVQDDYFSMKEKRESRTRMVPEPVSRQEKNLR
jgi:hypothetical protein